MTIISIVLVLLLCCFSFVLLYGAPYLPTLQKQIGSGLDLLDLQPGQTMLELGCGDGRVLVAAAKRGVICVGYELNPLLAFICWLRTRQYQGRVTVHCQDYWRATWPKTDAIYGFILAKYMKKLDTKVMQQKSRPIKVLSFAFQIPDRIPDKQADGLFLYEYK